MQHRLVSFHFEDDQLVTLQFSDGAYLTLSIGDAGYYLLPKDRTKLQHAYQLRTHFINTTLPPWATIVLLVGVALILLTGRLQVAGWQMLAPELPLVTPIVKLPQSTKTSTVTKTAAPATSPIQTSPVKRAEDLLNQAKGVLNQSINKHGKSIIRDKKADDKMKTGDQEHKHEES